MERNKWVILLTGFYVVKPCLPHLDDCFHVEHSTSAAIGVGDATMARDLARALNTAHEDAEEDLYWKKIYADPNRAVVPPGADDLNIHQ